MGRRSPLKLGRVLAVVLTFWTPLAAGADRETEARERYERALKLYEERAFDAALVELKLAAELRPSYKLLYNIAQVRLAMNDFAAALEAYGQYLAGGGDKIPAARREAVQRDMKRLEQRVARVTVEADAPGAEVFVDDVSVGTTPLPAPLLVNSGMRQVVVRHPEYVPQSRRLSLGGGVQQTVRFVFATPAPSANAPAATPTPGGPVLPTSQPPSTPGVQKAPTTASRVGAQLSRPTPSASPESESKSFPWLAWSITGALAAGTAVAGGLTLAEDASLEDAKKSQANSPAEARAKSEDLESKSSRVNTLAAVTDGLAIATLVAGGVSVWLTLKPSDETREQPALASRLRIGVRSNQLVVAGDF